MEPEELKTMARQALAEMREVAMHDGDTWSRPGGDRNVAEACASLAHCIGSPPAPNPSYTNMGEAAACLILLAATDPAAYSGLVGPILGKNSADARTMGGLVFLDNFLRAISDDHNYALDESGPRQVVRTLNEVRVPSSSLTPQRMLDLLRPILARPADLGLSR